MEKIIGIIDSSSHFTTSFCAYVNEKKVVPYLALAFTEYEAYAACREEYETVLLLISEEYAEHGSQLPDCPVIWLSDKQTDPERNRVNRYQGAEHLLKEILTRITVTARETPEGEMAELTAVYTPAGGTGQTSYALAYALNRSRNARILYLNLEACAGLSQLIRSEERDLSDALYYMRLSRAEQVDGKPRILSCVERVLSFDTIAPALCPEDLSELTTRELLDFLELLRGGNLYDELVLDVGTLIRQPWELFNNCTRLLVPVREELAMSRGRVKEFAAFLEKSAYRSVLGKLRLVSLPDIPEAIGRELSWELLEGPAWSRAAACRPEGPADAREWGEI